MDLLLTSANLLNQIQVAFDQVSLVCQRAEAVEHRHVSGRLKNVICEYFWGWRSFTCAIILGGNEFGGFVVHLSLP